MWNKTVTAIKIGAAVSLGVVAAKLAGAVLSGVVTALREHTK